jgi:hypothetical protein
MVADVIALLDSGAQLASSVLGKNGYRATDKICKALRTLYFTPKGVLSLLKAIERGETVEPRQQAAALIEFNDREWEAKDAGDFLDFDRLHKELGITLAAAKTLSLAAMQKLSLRRAIQDEINRYGQPRASPNIVRVRALITQIEKLNGEIEEIEGAVNRRAR